MFGASGEAGGFFVAVVAFFFFFFFFFEASSSLADADGEHGVSDPRAPSEPCRAMGETDWPRVASGLRGLPCWWWW